MRRGRTRVLCGIAALLLLVIGCERVSNAPPPVVTAPDLDAPEESVPEVARDSAGPAEAPDSAYSGEAEAPELPADVPLYTPARPISSMSSPTRGTIVHLRSDDAIDLVATWYATELPTHGWRLEAKNGASNSQLVRAVKGDRKATVLITGGPDGTQILLTVLEQR